MAIRSSKTEGLADAGESYRAAGGTKNTTDDGGVRYSEKNVIKTNESGTKHYDNVTELAVNDIAISPDGVMAVNINSKKSGLIKYPKSQWASVVANAIKTNLAGKMIVASDGDIITITNRGAREVAYGANTKKLRQEAEKNKDYAKVDQKSITAEHAASIIALSKYSSWSENADQSDAFKKDGIAHRVSRIYIDSVPYEATVLTALNGDPNQTKDYGEKFYDIVDIKEQTSPSAKTSGTLELRAVPHKIKLAERSSDRLTVTQKRRIVNNQNLKYSAGNTEAESVFAKAYTKALQDAENKRRYQSRDVAAVERANRSLERQNAKLKEDIKGLKKLLRLQKSVTKGRLFDPSSVDCIARYKGAAWS